MIMDTPPIDQPLDERQQRIIKILDIAQPAMFRLTEAFGAGLKGKLPMAATGLEISEAAVNAIDEAVHKLTPNEMKNIIVFTFIQKAQDIHRIALSQAAGTTIQKLMERIQPTGASNPETATGSHNP